MTRLECPDQCRFADLCDAMSVGVARGCAAAELLKTDMLSRSLVLGRSIC
jgi:hypothetical protein